jgi:cytochrome c553
MKPWTAAVSGLLVVWSASGFSADIEAGKAKSARCAGCHGSAGISTNPLWPNLAGQKMPYLVKQLKAFRAGTRRDPMMAPMTRALSDRDIEDLAAYYASLE